MPGVNGTSETSGRPIRKFNPGTFQSDEEVTEQFVVRKRELEIVLEVLRGNVDSPSCQHILVVGPRGRGKTMLLVRTAAELRTNKRLRGRLFPVRFMEESQEIFDMADFWLEALFHLARETEENDSDLSRELRETYSDLSSRWREQSLEAQARASVLVAADRLDRKIVLMVENLQSLCENLDEDFGWKLRQALQSEPQVMLLASATSRFEGLDDPGQPFFELFRNIILEPLTTEECRLLWHVVSGDPVSSREIRPLQILTGGNPRLLVIVAEFARHRSLRLLMEELVTLIDEHTEYFRGHLEVLAKTERRVYISVIDLWQPSSAGEIAARARMDIRIVSTMLGRLVERGAIIVEGSGRKRQYAAAERIFSIYYKLRRERDEAAVVENLITFMVVFYSGTELFDMAEGLVAEAAESPVIRTGIVRALTDWRRSEDTSTTIKWGIMHHVTEQALAKAQSTAEKELIVIIDTALRQGAYLNVIEIADRTVDRRRKNPTRFSDLFIARIMISKANAHEKLGQFQAAIAACEEVIGNLGDRTALGLQLSIAEALMNTARIRKTLGDLDAAVVACDKVMEMSRDNEELDLQWWVAVALNFKGATRRELGDSDGAIAAYEEVVARLGHSDVPRLQLRVAEAMVNTARYKRETGDLDAAVAGCMEVVERHGKSAIPDLQWWVAAALIEVARAKNESGDPTGAIEIWEEVVERYGDTDMSDIHWWVAFAMVDMGRVKMDLGYPDQAIAAWDEVIDRYGDSNESNLQPRVALALIEKGRARNELGDIEGAIIVWEDVVLRYDQSDIPELQRWVIAALINVGMRRAELGGAVEALQVCEEIDRRIGALSQTGETRLEWQVQCVRALSLMVHKKKDAALRAFRSAYAKFEPRNRISMHEMLHFVPNLLATGASEQELVEVLSTDPDKSLALAPLIVALRERQGQTVRAPAEVREVAADVRARIEERVKGWEDTTADSVAGGP